MNRSLMLFGIAALAFGTFLLTGGSDDDSKDGVTYDSSLDQHGVTWNNRLWIDKIPNTPKEKIDVFIAIDDPKIGFFQRTSAYEGDFSMFGWQQKDNKVGIEVLQSGKKHRLRMKVTDKNCGAFDYCMELKGAPRGGKRYFSMSDWVVEGRSLRDANSLAAWARAQLASKLSSK